MFFTPYAAVPFDLEAADRFASSYSRRLRDEFVRRFGENVVSVDGRFDESLGAVVFAIRSRDLDWQLSLRPGDVVESVSGLADRFVQAGDDPTLFERAHPTPLGGEI
jgi:hypothetical protein